MMHYYMHYGPAAFRFELAGELDTKDAARLEQDCRTASSIIGKRTLIIDMSFVTRIDEAVRSLFKRWYSDGAEFAADSRRSRELVESITERSFAEPPNPATYQPWISLSVTALVALLTFLLPAQVRGADEGATLALTRFLAHSQSTAPENIAVEIEASLPQMDRYGEVEAIRHSEAAGAIQYEVVRSGGDSMVRQQVIARYLTIEQQAHARPASFSAVTPENYHVRYMASIEHGANRFYVYTIKPRHRGQGLMEGQIWIDAATGALVHQEGRMTRVGSVFVRKIEIVRDMGPRADSPFFRITRVDIDTRGFGHAELTIRERPAISISNGEVWQ